MDAKLWTAKHVNEAKAALYRLAAEAIAKGDSDRARDLGLLAAERWPTESENGFITALIPHTTLARDAVRIRRTVRARADGREVETVEVFWRVKLASGAYADTDPDNDSSTADAKTSTTHFEQRFQADIEKKGWPPSKGVRVVRVTLTRRRILRAEMA
jgi:hypothetical protein